MIKKSYYFLFAIISFLSIVSAASNPMTTATRTAGVAPLLVVFDPIDLSSQNWSSGVVQPTDRDYASFYYAWNYGDNHSGSWSTDGKAKNTDAGMIASHVYETAGVYNATLSVTLSNDTVYTYYETINVTDFSGTTYYVANNGNDSNNGTDTSHPLQTYNAGIAKASTNTRILFNRGDTFNSSYIQVINADGPGIVGAYGNGADPLIQDIAADENGILGIGGADWRIMDLNFTGIVINATRTWSAIQGAWSGPNQDLLLFRLSTSGFHVGLGWGDSAPPHENMGVVECHVYEDYTNGVYVGGRHMAILGNTVDHMGISHLLRIWQGVKTFVSHNLLDTPGGDRHNIKLAGYGEDQIAAGGYLRTTYVELSDNILVGINVWSTAIGPQDSGSDERISDVIYERNFHSKGGIDVLVWASNVTVRNNVFTQDEGQDGTAVSIGPRGIEPAPDNVRVYDNTAYMLSNSSHRSNVIFAQINSVSTNVVVENNILSAPFVDLTPHLIEFSSPYSIDNGTNNLVLLESDFIDASSGDYRLNSSSSAVGAGNSLYYVRDDFTGGIRSSTPDIGAYDSSASSVTICGDNIVETGETCDDGNLVSGDGCDSSCQVEISSQPNNNNSGGSSGGGGGGGVGSSAMITNKTIQVANSSDLPKGTDSGKNSVIGKVFPQVDNKETKISGFEYTLWFYVFVVVILLSIGVTVFVSLMKILG